MIKRRIICVLALLGLLMQAGFAVRHNTAMIATLGGGSAESQFLAGGVSAICHNAGTAESESPPQGGDTGPSSPASSCPICNGLCVAAALPAPLLVLPSRQITEIAATEPETTLPARHHSRLRPPSRAPPAGV